ncbi:roadblock/LC7 domain-containing protein [Actinoplanes sp. CA-015351]|uniref:Putative regulator of Ras-like GTPase activity (Roadblock/LC7/MglB family) n=1 Tax=Actinoplanes lutulentus TaxID=1287878 RepID=A0A327ZKP3_9ACTN|nr:roadblock/LC7 domain-containing protein [Actinoplanes lutulentus]MBB2940890.1 putative regulator of Ras-like GTPase activity (Roadblock/LC7/MglB family) [Actinoplanes lutulentus]RAK43199.1 putative regulator of Ras-like GTPase activity (Roadblock/LC7/MglB family) [Actinoplanes lutulentus]
MTNPTSSIDLPWMLDDLVEVPQVVSVVVLSTDGLIVQKSTSMQQDLAEILAAGASSMYSVAAGTGRHFKSGPVQQVVIEYGEHTLFIAAAGQNARLAVLCEQDVDMGMVAYEVSRLVARIGDYLSAPARSNDG